MNHMKTPRLAVITVGYKSKKDLDEYFSSLYASTFKDFDVIFLDNASEDGTPEWISAHYPQALLRLLEKNVGFAEGNNIGMREALKGDYEYVFLLNPDTAISPDCLQKLLEAADEKSVLQPLLLLHKDGQQTETVNSAGNTLNYLGFSYAGHYLEPASNFNEEKDVALCSGAVMFIPAAIVRAVGELDGSFFTYHEDVDLSWRIRQKNYAIRLVPAARVWHKYEFNKSKRKFFYAERNRLLFMAKTYELRTLALILPFMAVTEILMCAFALKDGWLPQKLAGYGSFLREIPSALSQRKKIQKTRILSDKDLSPWWSSTLQFGAVKIPGAGLFNAVCSGYWDIVSRWL
jgi:GT2 family glycosyltransferase